MSKKVLVISTSLRQNSNSDILADEFIRGSREAGCEVEKISLAGKQIGFCRGCLACQKTQKCVIQDDAVGIAEKMRVADAVAFVTPIYYYEMSGQMKTLLDRMNPLFPADYHFREVYLIATAADGDPAVMDGAANGLEGWISCFPKTQLAGVVRGIGVNDSGEVKDHPELLHEAYAMGISTLTCFNN